MASIILLPVVLIVYHFKFWVLPSQTALTSSPRKSGRNSPDLSPCFGQCCCYFTSCEAKNNSRV